MIEKLSAHLQRRPKGVASHAGEGAAVGRSIVHKVCQGCQTLC